MAAVGILQSMLGFGDADIALMIATYIALDSFGTATNVTGDGAIALAVDRFAGRELRENMEEDSEGFDADQYLEEVSRNSSSSAAGE